MGKRIYSLGGLLMLCCLIILIKLAYIQLYSSSTYADASFRLRSSTLTLEEYARGDILDRNGKSLLNSHTDPALIILPQLISDPQGAVNFLRPYFSANTIDADDFSRHGNRHSAPIILPINDNHTLYALQRKLPTGMIIAPYRWRYNQPFAIHLLGYLNHDGVGVKGLEKYYDENLTDTQATQSLAYISDVKNNLLTGNGLRLISNPHIERSDLVLTLDYDIQALLESTLDEHHVAKGAAIILDSASNEILAAVSRPIYDPTKLTQTYGFNDNQLERSMSSEYRYYPGSSFKIATALAALNEGIANDSTTFICDNTAPYNKCPRPHGEIDFQQALKVSCNNYFIYLGQILGSDTLEKYLVNTLHFTLEPKKKLDSSTAIANGVIGQELFRVTPLQMAELMSTVANDGKQCLYDAPWQKRITLGLQKNDNFIDLAPTAIWQQSFSPQAAQALQQLLTTSLQQPDGTAITYAGKTGTPEVYDAQGNKAYLAWYVGYCPADQPRYVIAIVIEDILGIPTQELSGGKYALPIFQQLTRALTF